MTLCDDQTLYIAGGAIVYGAIKGSPNGARVMGRGILDGQYQHRLVELEKASDVQFEGVILRNGVGWQNTIYDSENIVYDNVKVISFGRSGDGINPVGCKHFTIKNCFLRCTDDCVAIKSPGATDIVEDIRVLDSTMIGYAFSDGVTIGFETNGPYVRDVLVKNCDILLSRGHSRVDGHSAFSIICDGPARISNIRYEDLRIEERVLKLFELHITDGSKYGENPPGHINGVYLKNIRWDADLPIVLKGFDADHLVQNVVFENCTVGNRRLSSKKDACFKINEHVSLLSFK
jgi:polygalacturonase